MGTDSTSSTLQTNQAHKDQQDYEELARGKVFKSNLLFKEKNGNQCNIQINRKAFAGLKAGDVLEVSQIENKPNSATLLGSSLTNSTGQLDNIYSSPILLQVVEDSFKDEIKPDIIYITSDVNLEPFNIQRMAPVHVKRVKLEDVQLDLVELIFKDQYFNGSDMWRLKQQIEKTCIYVKKNIEFCGMRCTVREIWMNGEIVTCGYVGPDTRLVFRSQSAMCSIYIQMSSEMWEFDVNGEMYHEKAINFLSELFTNWKNQTCQHDVTITLFSRVFYDAKTIDEFPSATQECIKQDHRNRFYEDFYRVIYQNKRYDDWMFALIKLKRLIKEYREYVSQYHERYQYDIVPRCKLSNSAEGNFLETLNLSSSVFERHFIDRPFDRTGMMSLVITAGRGIFEVSHELCKITKERVIDNGIGSDLVCLGEQPLHSVPLFKYAGSIERFTVPHWINLSFYKSSDIVRFCNSKFIPRIKIHLKENDDHSEVLDSNFVLPGYDPRLSTLEDDTEEFYRAPKNTDSLKRMPQSQRISTTNESLTMSSISKYSHKKDEDSEEDSSFLEDSDDEVSHYDYKTRNKINPFSPSTIKPKMSFDRRRFAHIFPLNPDGSPIFPHRTTVKSSNLSNIDMINSHENVEESPSTSIQKFNELNKRSSPNIQQQQSVKKRNDRISTSSLQYPNTANPVKSPNKVTRSITSQLNEIELAGDDVYLASQIVVSWKSLTFPACLPLTTDFVPAKKIWEKKFVVISNYTLLLQEIREQYGYVEKSGHSITMKSVVPELVGHRLAMGFQLIKLNPTQNFSEPSSHLIKEKFKLSLGSVYHDLLYLVDDEGKESVEVKISALRVKNDQKNKNEQNKDHYNYRFQVPDSRVYLHSHCALSPNNIKIKWNNIDSYICIQGNGSLSPLGLGNCWRQRLYLLPILQTGSNLLTDTQEFEKNYSNHQLSGVDPKQLIHFDVYDRKNIEELITYREKNFLCFMEYLNKVQRENTFRITSNGPKNSNLLPSPKENVYTMFEEKRSSNEIISYLENTYKNPMLEGIPFLHVKNDIPPKCFVSAEATWWCMQNIADIDTEADAIAFLQLFLDFNIIRHISKVDKMEKNRKDEKEENFEKTYIHGFYLYYILTNENKKLDIKYTKDYCEVGLCDLYCGTVLEEKNLFFSKNLPKLSKLLPVFGTDYSYSQFGLNLTLESPILKIVNVDVDPNNKSNRVEWASAIYRSYYHPLAAFELEIYWKMATGQLLSELVNNWAKMSNKFGYHIVPGTLDPFVTPMDSFADPLRGYIYLKMDEQNLLQEEMILFENFVEKKYYKLDDNNNLLLNSSEILSSMDCDFIDFLKLKYNNDSIVSQKLQDLQQLMEQDFQEFIERERILRLQYFQEAILEKFGFIRNAAITKQHNSDDDATFFIHSSGGMFVSIPNYYAHYTGRSRHPSAVNQTTLNQNMTKYQPQKIQNALEQIHIDTKNNNSQTAKIFDNDSIDGLSKADESQTKSGFIEKYSSTQDSTSSSNTNEQKILEKHVNYSNKSAVIKYDPVVATSCLKNNNSSVNGNNNNTQRARSNTKSHIQFYDINKKSINDSSLNDQNLDDIEQLIPYKPFSNSSTSQKVQEKDTVDSSSSNSNETVKNESKLIKPQMIILDKSYTFKKKQPFYNGGIFIGFIWSWNFMLGNRWRSQFTGDEYFQDCALADFRAFVSNKEDRLIKFYNDSKNSV